MKITILGAGSAYGSPMAGNWNTCCDLANEKNHRTRSCLFLEDNNDNLLVECGPDFRQQTNKYNVSNVDNIFISHGHSDHMGGIWELTYWVKLRSATINVYGDENTINEIKIRFPFLFRENFNEMGEGRVIFNVIENGKKFKLENSSMELLPMRYIHSSSYSHGFRYKDFVFTPDLEYIPNATTKNIENANLWIVECDTVENMRNGHIHLDLAIEWFKKYNPKRMILNHLSSDVDYEKVSKILPKGMELAFDGMVLNVQ
jgi:phosphoribosyl 1,2-cyclic phosphate phosphodiesterase